MDLLYIHWWDWDRSVVEVARSYLLKFPFLVTPFAQGISITPARVASKATQYARDHPCGESRRYTLIFISRMSVGTFFREGKSAQMREGIGVDALVEGDSPSAVQTRAMKREKPSVRLSSKIHG